MLYDQLGVRFVRVEVTLIPPDADRFPEGALSHLYAALNQGDAFDTCTLRLRLGAKFEGEDVTFDVSPDRIILEFRSFQDFAGGVKERTAQLLQETNNALSDYNLGFLYLLKKAEVRALVPEGHDKDVGALIRAKLPVKLRQPSLPGEIHGAGIEFVGSTPDYSYTATIAPFLPEPDNLYLGVELTYRIESFVRTLMEEPDKARDPVEHILDNLQVAYDLCTTELPSFAQTFLP